jgi:FeS assembly SUF system protein
MSSQRLPLPMDTPEVSPDLPPAQAPAEQQAGAEPGRGLTWEETEELKNQIVAALCTCFDPEIPVNIYELGLIYNIEIAPSAAVAIRMTLTSPACPAAGSLPPEVERKVRDVAGVTGAKVDVVWDPPWDKSRMSEAAKLQLGIDD